MSQDRSKVFQTTRVRTVLKNDGSWIHKSTNVKEEQDKAGPTQAVETKPVPVRQNSYVLLTAKKFGAIDSAMIPPLQKTEVAPCEGDIANGENEVIPTQQDTQPEGSTVETTGDTRPQTPTEEIIPNCKAHPETSVENKEEYSEVLTDKSNVEHSEVAAEVSADVHAEEYIQPASPAKESPEAVVCPVEPAEQPLATTTAENKEEHADAPADPSDIDQNETKVSADANVENPVAEISAVDGTVENKDTAEDPTALIVELKPQEESLIKTESVNPANLEDAGVEISVQPTEGSCEMCPADVSATEETVAVATKVLVESLPELPAVNGGTPGEEAALQNSVQSDIALVTVTNATPGEEASVQVSVESVPDLLVESVSQSPTQPAAETTTDGSCEKCSPEVVEPAAEVLVESLPELPAVNGGTPGEEAALQNSVQSVPDTLPELPTQSAAETEVTYETCPPEESTAAETVEAVVEVMVAASPETAAINNATPGDDAALQNSVEPVPHTLSESPGQPAVETVIKSVECKVESAALTEEVSTTQSKEVVECEACSADNTVVEQSVEPTAESAADHVVELNIEDALKPASDAEAVQDKSVDRVITLTDALDVELPTAEAVPKPVEDPKLSTSEEQKLNQQCDDTNTVEVFQKPAEKPSSTYTLKESGDGKAICSFCDLIIDGNVKITLSEPLVRCHPECLKCGVCAMVLGDMLTPMFLHHQVIQCGGCFAEAVKI